MAVVCSCSELTAVTGVGAVKVPTIRVPVTTISPTAPSVAAGAAGAWADAKVSGTSADMAAKDAPAISLDVLFMKVSPCLTGLFRRLVVGAEGSGGRRPREKSKTRSAAE